MRKGIHPPLGMIVFRCAACSEKWLATSTKVDAKLEEFEGKEYPTIVLETCSNCHPFFTDKQTFIDTAGRVEKFQKRFAKFQPKEDEKPAETQSEPEASAPEAESEAPAPEGGKEAATQES